MRTAVLSKEYSWVRKENEDPKLGQRKCILSTNISRLQLLFATSFCHYVLPDHRKKNWVWSEPRVANSKHNPIEEFFDVFPSVKDQIHTLRRNDFFSFSLKWKKSLTGRLNGNTCRRAFSMGML